MFARPPWCWPGSVTRAQTLRDLQMIVESFSDAEEV